MMPSGILVFTFLNLPAFGDVVWTGCINCDSDNHPDDPHYCCNWGLLDQKLDRGMKWRHIGQRGWHGHNGMPCFWCPGIGSYWNYRCESIPPTPLRDNPTFHNNFVEALTTFINENPVQEGKGRGFHATSMVSATSILQSGLDPKCGGENRFGLMKLYDATHGHNHEMKEDCKNGVFYSTDVGAVDLARTLRRKKGTGLDTSNRVVIIVFEYDPVWIESISDRFMPPGAFKTNKFIDHSKFTHLFIETSQGMKKLPLGREKLVQIARLTVEEQIERDISYQSSHGQQARDVSFGIFPSNLNYRSSPRV